MRRTINYKVESIWRARAGRVLLNAIDPAQGALTTKLLLTVGDDLSFYSNVQSLVLYKVSSIKV